MIAARLFIVPQTFNRISLGREKKNNHKQEDTTSILLLGAGKDSYNSKRIKLDFRKGFLEGLRRYLS